MTFPVDKGPPPDGFTELFHAKLEPPKWVVRNVIPVGMTMLGAPEKALKSTTTEVLTAVVTEMLPEVQSIFPPDLCVAERPGHVLYCSAEASAGAIKYNFEHDFATKIKVPNDGRYLVVDDPFLVYLSDPDGFAHLEEGLRYYEPRLLIIDPLRNFHHWDENDNAGDLVRVLGKLQRWAVKNERAILILHHARKAQPGEQRIVRAQDLRGAGALPALMDGILTITPTDDSNGSTYMTAKFRRGGHWERQFTLGAYGRTYTEPMQDIDKGVLPLVGKVQIEAIAQQLKQAKSAVLQSVERLERLGYLRRDGARLVRIR